MVDSDEFARFVQGMPKVDLHVHQIGSLTPRIISELSDGHPESPVPHSPSAIEQYLAFADLNDFVRIYLSIVELIRSPVDIRMITYEVAREMAKDNIRYAELTCTPYISVIHGIDAQDYCAAIEDAREAAEKYLGVTLRWVFDIPGDFGRAGAEETLEIATDIAPEGLVGFGLGGSERGIPRSGFAPYFFAARSAGLYSVPHAGENDGPQSIWDAIQLLRADRVGHGTSATEDPGLMRHLAENDIPLEVCPTSNLATKRIDSIDEHPVKNFDEYGVPFSVNSDDPGMFATTLTGEYVSVARLLGLQRRGVADRARAAVSQSFAPTELKRNVLSELEAYVSAWLAGE